MKVYTQYFLNPFEKPYKYEPGESLNIIAHSHGGNVVKQMSHYYDYTQDKIPTVVTIATPNRKDYTMDTHIKEYYNVYNTYDNFVQGFAGGSDTPNKEGWGRIYKSASSNSYNNDNYTFITSSSDKKGMNNTIVPLEDLQKFHYTIPSQTAREPNAVNVEIEQDYGRVHVIDNHSKFKNPETMQILQKEMEKRGGNE